MREIWTTVASWSASLDSERRHFRFEELTLHSAGVVSDWPRSFRTVETTRPDGPQVRGVPPLREAQDLGQWLDGLGGRVRCAADCQGEATNLWPCLISNGSTVSYRALVQ